MKKSARKALASTKDPLDHPNLKKGGIKLSSKCKDHQHPEICRHKSILCDDKTHKTHVRNKCAMTCGLCRLKTKSKCRDRSMFCKAYKRKCSNKKIKRLCPRQCGACF